MFDLEACNWCLQLSKPIKIKYFSYFLNKASGGVVVVKLKLHEAQSYNSGTRVGLIKVWLLCVCLEIWLTPDPPCTFFIQFALEYTHLIRDTERVKKKKKSERENIKTTQNKSNLTHPFLSYHTLPLCPSCLLLGVALFLPLGTNFICLGSPHMRLL